MGIEIGIKQLHVLCVDNVEQDIAAIELCLERELNCPVFFDVVHTQSTFLQHIKSKVYDVILSNYSLSDYNAVLALKQALSVCPKVPFICISGTVGEETAVDLIKQGASDFVLKERIGRLPNAVRQAIVQANEKSEADRHSEFRHTILKLSQGFINLPFEQMDEAINNALKMVAQYCGVDRATVFRYEWQKGIAVRVYEWNGDSQIQVMRTIPQSALSALVESHEERNSLRSSSHDRQGDSTDNPGDPDSQDRQDSFDSVDTAHEAAREPAYGYPMIIDGLLIGMLELSPTKKQKKLSDAETAIIKVFCELMGSVFRRKEYEAALWESREGYKLILDSTMDSVAMMDCEGMVLRINAQFAKRLGLSKLAFKGINYRKLFPKERYGDLAEQQLQKVQEVFKTGKFVLFEDEREGRSYENRCYPVTKDHKVTAVTLFSTDISDRKKAQEESRIRAEFEAKLQVMTEFFTTVSHEFKTPLSVILMQLELMMLYLDDESMMLKLITATTQNAYRLSKLVCNILDITKIEAGFMKARYASTNIVNVIENVCEAVSSYAKAKEIQLRFHSTVKAKIMAVDTEKTQRAMLNLLSNAIKFTGKGGKILVKVESRKEGGVRISVADTGEGIPKHKQKVVFERFTQVDPSIARQNEGCGMGLALVKSIVEMLRGTIHVKSEVGKGSKFTICLPEMAIGAQSKDIQIESYDLGKKAAMELSDIYMK